MKLMTKISQVLLFVTILGNPGAVRRVGSKGATKVISSTGEKAPGYRLSPDHSPNGQANASSWLGTKNALYYCAQSDSWQPRKRRRKSEYTFFSLYRDYSNSLTLSNASELVWSWISINHIQVYKEKENFVIACLRPPRNVKLGIITW